MVNMDKAWKGLEIINGCKIRKVVGLFEVEDYVRIPYGKYKVKVLENQKGDFIAYPNIAYNCPDNGPQWVSGMGKSVEQALQDAIQYLVNSIPEKHFFYEEYFEWSAPEDF